MASLRWWIGLLLVTLATMNNNNEAVGGVKAADDLGEHLPMPKGTLKTIENEKGEVVDCVDIYQQPAFTNPLLKNHPLQANPNSIPRSVKLENDESYSRMEHVQTWSCPQGTVPIRRPRENESGIQNLRKRPLSNVTNQNAGEIHKYAAATLRHTKADIYGLSASINIWNPTTEPRDFSLAQIWVTNDLNGDNQMETLEAGWMIYRNKFNDFETKLFIYYTNDGYRTPCYNLECGGFVQKDTSIGLGTTILRPYSEYNGVQYDATFAIVKDSKTKDWWFYFQGKAIGYWPARLFKGLSTAANGVQWGGEILEDPGSTHPTTTQMGSGRFPEEFTNRAAYIRDVHYYDANNRGIMPVVQNYVQTHPLCYRITPVYYFGGPGKSATCTA